MLDHRLRTPLSIALGYAELLAEGAFGDLSPEARRAAETVREKLLEVRRWVELLLELAAGGREKPLEVRVIEDGRVREASARIRLDPAGKIIVILE